MWTVDDLVEAVRDGYTFPLPFKPGRTPRAPNAYWIAGKQYAATDFIMGPEFTPELGVIPVFEWIYTRAFFEPHMVPEEAWIEPPDPESETVPVYVEIDPNTIDWDLLNSF
jgi:hypothetical protein